MKKINLNLRNTLPIIISLVLIAGIYLGYKLAPVSTYQHNFLSLRSDQYNKVTEIINYIEQDYVDSVSRDELTEDAIAGILEQLDPHSQYIPPNTFDEVNEHLMGNFEGIGVQFRMEEDTILVILPIEGGPSAKVGILAGDRIVKINDSLVAGIGFTSDDAMKLLKGKKGTTVTVSVYRRGLPNLIDFTITRDVIPTYSLDIAYMVDDSIGYIRLNKFAATTYREFSEAMRELLDKGMQKLVFDLRGNAGGYLKSAIQIADDFLEDNKLIVYTEGKNRPRDYSYATERGVFEKNELAILIDEGSASASEIIAGAVQDNDRATIIGRRSFGKGLVQEQLNMPDRSALRLTVARYYTPTGRSIQRPYVNGNEEYYTDFYERYVNGELSNADSIHFNDSLKYTTPGGKIVYGGGGIMPDIYVPFNMDDEAKYYNKLVRKGLIFRFAFKYADSKRQDLQQYASPESFRQDFRITGDLYREFISFAEEHGAPYDPKTTPYFENKIKVLLKAYIARNLFDDEGFYPIYHTTDETFLKAIEVLRQ
jgi:carboxyl-terminal processing protease